MPHKDEVERQRARRVSRERHDPEAPKTGVMGKFPKKLPAGKRKRKASERAHVGRGVMRRLRESSGR